LRLDNKRHTMYSISYGWDENKKLGSIKNEAQEI
jgi:hypothetical protein